MRALTCLTSSSAVYFFFKKQMARPSYLLNHNPITNLVCITYGYGNLRLLLLLLLLPFEPFRFWLQIRGARLGESGSRHGERGVAI